MSALWAPVTEGGEVRAATRRSARLRAVDPPAARMSRAPFLLVLIGVFGLGMAGLLMLNTTLQNQAFAARALDRQATELAYIQADLENQIDVLSAPPELGRQASALGMRPNPHPAFLVLPEGRVVGKPTPVTGNEVPSMVVKTPAEIAAEKAAAKAKAAADKKAAEERARALAKAEKEAAEAAAKKAAEKKAADAAAEKAAEKKAAAKKAAEKKAAEKKAAEKKPAEGAQTGQRAADPAQPRATAGAEQGNRR